MSGILSNFFCNQTRPSRVSSSDRLIFMLMKRPILMFATAAALLAGAPVDFASPFNPKDVAADPALLFHVDCDALRASSVGQSILSEPEVKDKLAAVGAIFDFDISKQLHGLTVYTTEAHPKDGVLIVYADFDPDRLIRLAEGAEGFQSATNGSHVIYSWLDDKKKAKDGERPRICGAILGHRVIFGQNDSHLAEALVVMDGKAPSFSGPRSLPGPGPGESILAQGELLKFDFDSDDDKAAILKMSKSVRLKLSEVNHNMTASVHLEAADAETATKVATIAQGLLALLQLQKSDPNILKLANSIMVKQDGPAVGLTLSEPSSDLIDMIKDGQQKAEKQAQDDKTVAKSPPEDK
jgi:hypothetical protein